MTNGDADPFRLAQLFEDHFRDSLRGDPPPAGYQHWAYKLVRSDHSAGGSLSWPTEAGALVEPGDHTDGHAHGCTAPGTLAVVTDIRHLARSSAVGGSAVLTLAFGDEDVVTWNDSGLVLLRRAYLADTDPAHLNLGHHFSDPTYRALNSIDVSSLRARERASFLGPEPLQPPGLDVRRRVASPVPPGDWFRTALACYRQPPNDVFDVAAALAAIAGTKTCADELSTLSLHVGILRNALTWDRQVAIQRRIDGYLHEHFGRADPRTEDPERPMSRIEQWLHLYPYAPQLLNLAETLIELDLIIEDLGDDPAEFLQEILPDLRRLRRASERDAHADTESGLGPMLDEGPAFQILPGTEDAIPRYTTVTALYLTPSGLAKLVSLEDADAPGALRIRQAMLGKPLRTVALGSNAELVCSANADDLPHNVLANRLLEACYPDVDELVGGNVIIVGHREGHEADVPASLLEQLAGLGVVPDQEILEHQS
ncbi:hypothetical protein [Amycolatopsis sp. ATCC 39116]|uniref:hypothetical protein n=1 Tax=Amycolatopsis sp. (strain ATCC 39116 / 75iv2) TaxID=385957 RepID=UPI00026258F2|nr:hypothetical protein [Amycolatopsis sp. ATCC 39116]